MNRPCLQATKFVNHPQGTVTHGWRFYDYYGQCYDNTLDSLPDDDLELLSIVTETKDETAVAMLNYLQENESGLYIGDEWYNWCDIKQMWVE